MGLIGNLLERPGDAPGLEAALARAVSVVEPLLAQTKGYPERYLSPVRTALNYATQLAASVPGPVTVDREAYAKDALVHALFPDVDAISAAFTSSLGLQNYLRGAAPGSEFYALMGMRRIEKKIIGMEPAGMIVQRDVLQQAVYFGDHTIESPSPSEALAREQIALRFFDALAGKVRERIEQRRQARQALADEIDMLLAHLRAAFDSDRPDMEQRLEKLTDNLQYVTESLDLERYAEDFEAVLLQPQQHLRLQQIEINLDSMGIRRTGDEADRGKAIVFSELIGYDRRDWAVIVVKCVNLQQESFAERLDDAYRRLTL